MSDHAHEVGGIVPLRAREGRGSANGYPHTTCKLEPATVTTGPVFRGRFYLTTWSGKFPLPPPTQVSSVKCQVRGRVEWCMVKMESVFLRKGRCDKHRGVTALLSPY